MKIDNKKIVGSVLVLIVASFLVMAVSFNLWDDREIGYEFLDGGEVVHIWNTQDDYFFDKDKGIQLTNHYEDYWTRNIFCIGYYNGGIWNKIYCADDLTNFNKDIHSDNLTYVNATLWKDVTYGSYDLRLGIRYHLGLDDKNLSVIIYGKNIGIDIPYDLGFAWKVTDWEIPHNTTGGDSIKINDTHYELNGTFNLLFKNMTKSHNITIMTNNITNVSHEETIYTDIPFFRGYDYTKFLRIDWDKDLNYAVKMVGNGNQSEFYVALLINAGHFNAGQEKSTTFQWIDAEGDYVSDWDTEADGNTKPVGLGTDGTNIWTVDYVQDEVYKWDMIGNAVTHWDTNADGNLKPHGLTTDGTNIWTTDVTTGAVHKWDMVGNHVTSWATDGAGNNNPVGITTDGINIWTTDSTGSEVYKWAMDGTSIGHWDTAACGNTMPRGITTDGTNIWIADSTGDKVYKYDMDGVADSNWDIGAAGNTEAYGITVYGSYIRTADYTGTQVYKWEGPAVADSEPPNVTIVTPTNSTYNTTTIVFNFTAVDETAMDSCFYQIDGGANLTMTNTTASSFNATNLSMTQGSHTIRALCNDTSDNFNLTETVTFFIDSIYPKINITFPLNNTNTTDTSLDIKYVYTEVNCDRVWWTNVTTNLSLSCGNNLTNETWAEGKHNITIWMNDTANNVNLTYVSFTIDTTAPIVTFVSQIPTDVMWNSTGIPEVLFNVTDATSVNDSSVVFFHGVNHSNILTHWNWSNRILDEKSNIYGWRANNRNESNWWENVVYKESVNDIWSFAGYDVESYSLSILNNSSIHTYYNYSKLSIHELFPTVFYIDRTDITKENKLNQYINIYKHKPVRINYNLTIYNLTANFTNYEHLNIETQGSAYDLIAYVCNSSYSIGNPKTNDNCQAGSHITGTDIRTITLRNSTYIDNKTHSGKNGSYGSVILTRHMSLVLFTDEPLVGNSYKLYFANNTLADNTNFNETNVLWTSGNNGIAWTQYEGTADYWYSPAQKDYDKIVYYVYACDDLGNCANSTWQTDTLEKEPNLAPSMPTITSPEENDNVFIPFFINWTTAGDPNGDEYNATIQIHNLDGSLNRVLADNNITSDITYFNVTDLADGTYRINITLCDIHNACASTLTGWTFDVGDLTIPLIEIYPSVINIVPYIKLGETLDFRT